MQKSCLCCPAEGRYAGPLLPISWRQPFLLTPMALHVFFLFYAVNCIVFYKDRMILDAIAWLNGNLLAQNAMFMRHGRIFIQWPPQALPWLAVQIGLPLKGVVLAYSLGFCFYHYLMALLLYYGFRRRDLATLLVLVIVLYLVHNNFYPIADGMHIVPWALCMLAVLQYPAQRLPGRILVGTGAVLFALITTSSHLFGLPLSLAMGGYAFFRSDQRKRLLPVLAAMVIVLLCFYFWRRMGMNEYESGKISQVGLETLRQNGLNFVRYFAFAHAFALAGVTMLAFLGLFYAGHRGVYWFSALCALGYAALIACYTLLNERYIHFYYWHCLLPMYAILAVPFFDARGVAPVTRICSRLLFAVALVWAMVGSMADLTELRERSDFQTNLVNALTGDGKRLFLVDENQLSRDYVRAFAPDFLQDETSTRTAMADPAKATLLMSRKVNKSDYWAFLREMSDKRSPYLAWLPLKRDAFIPAIVPASRSEIQQRSARISLDYPEQPTSVRIIDGWLSNYVRLPKLVYSVPVTVTNRGDNPFPATDTEGKPVMFGYYWHLDGRILFEDLKAEYLPINVRTTFEHVLNVQRKGIPRDARLTIDLFLNDRPLLHPDAYYALISPDQGFARWPVFGSAICPQMGFYSPEGSQVWMKRQARLEFIRDLRRCTFSLAPPPNVDANNPVDIEVRCEAAGAVFTHRFTDSAPFAVTVETPQKGQVLSITASADFCPAGQGSTDTRALALKLYGVDAVPQ